MSKTMMQVLEERKSEFMALLPKDMNVERFIQIGNNAILNCPDVRLCTPNSIVRALTRCATDNLLPDGREATLTVRNCKQKDGSYQKEAVYTPMYRGLLKKIFETGEVLKADAYCVYSNEHFTYEAGDDERIIHKPILNAERGNFVCAYSIIKLKNGEISREVIGLEEINKIKAKATTQAIWNEWFSSMAKKSVLRRHCGKIPLIEMKLSNFIENDNQNFDFDSGNSINSTASLPSIDSFLLEETKEEPKQETETLEIATKQGQIEELKAKGMITTANELKTAKKG